MNFKYVDMSSCSVEFEAEDYADKELLQEIYVKLIRNPSKVNELLKKMIK